MHVHMFRVEASGQLILVHATALLMQVVACYRTFVTFDWHIYMYMPYVVFMIYVSIDFYVLFGSKIPQLPRLPAHPHLRGEGRGAWRCGRSQSLVPASLTRKEELTAGGSAGQGSLSQSLVPVLPWGPKRLYTYVTLLATSKRNKVPG